MKICTIKGIPIEIHKTFYLILIYVFAMNIGSGLAQTITAMIKILLAFCIVGYHELAHSIVALKFGIKVRGIRGITFLPIGGAAMLEIPKNPVR